MENVYEVYMNNDFKKAFSMVDANPDFMKSGSDQAMLLITEIMNRVDNNLKLIVRKLFELDYEFEDEGAVIGNYDSIGLVERLEEMVKPFGNISLSYCQFIRQFGCLNLIGSFPEEIENESHPILDPLHFYSLKDVYEYHEFVLTDSNELPLINGDPYLLISKDELSKEGTSGSGLGYGIKLLATPGLDAEICNYGMDVNFLGYLRLGIFWGGFPNMQWFFEDVDKSLKEKIRYLQEGIVKF